MAPNQTLRWDVAFGAAFAAASPKGRAFVRREPVQYQPPADLLPSQISVFYATARAKGAAFKQLAGRYLVLSAVAAG